MDVAKALKCTTSRETHCMNKHAGSCLCSAVAYEVEGDFERFYLCHCSRCRKNSGSAHSANLFATGASLKWLRGGDQVARFELPGTRHSRSFCSVCGSALPTLQENGALLVVPARSLDSEVMVRPDAHICAASRASWDKDMAAVPTLEGLC